MKIILWDVGMVSCFGDDGNGRVYFVEQAFFQGSYGGMETQR